MINTSSMYMYVELKRNAGSVKHYIVKRLYLFSSFYFSRNLSKHDVTTT